MADPNKPAVTTNEPPKPETAPEALVPIKLLYDTWNAKEERIPAGTFTSVPTAVAKQLIADGKAERADPLPGEAE